MDKFTKNPNDPGFSADSPKPSSTDSMIEQYKIDLSKKSYNDIQNTRRLTIEPDITPDSDIDQQITELEDMIKKLQEEIEEMSINADKRAEEEYTIVTKRSSTRMNGAVGHVYPIILRDVSMNLQEPRFQGNDDDQGSPAMDTGVDISKNYETFWYDNTINAQNVEDELDENIDKLIEELQSELIAEKMNESEEAEGDEDKSPEDTKPKEDTDQ